MKIVISLFLIFMSFGVAAASEGSTLLQLFAGGNMPSTAEVLLELDRGAHVNARDEEGKTALMLAVTRSQRTKVISYDPNTQSKRVRVYPTPKPDYQTVEELLIAGAHVNAADNDGVTPLMYAISNHSSDNEIIELLLKNDASIRQQDNSGSTAIMYAYRTQNFNAHVASLLLKAGSEINMTDRKGASIFIDNLSRGLTPEGLRLIIEAGFDFSLRGSSGQTLLHQVVGLNDESALYEVFAAAGVDIDEPDTDGNTVLMKTAMGHSHRPAIIKTLVKLGANPNAKNKEGDTPLLVTCRRTSVPEVVATLIDVGANPFIKDSKGHDALSLARKNKKLEGSESLMALEALIRMQQ